MYVISTGNAFDGMALIGTFDSYEEALEYAEDGHNRCDNWEIVELHSSDSVAPIDDSDAEALKRGSFN